MNYSLVIHAGAGALKRDQYPNHVIKECYSFLLELNAQGLDWLKLGESADLVAEKVVVELENFPHFNAGKGSVLNSEGVVEMDASFSFSFLDKNCESKTLCAGLSGLKKIKNPIKAAKLLAIKDHHTLLAGEGAENFCLELGLEICPADYFITDYRLQQHHKFLKDRKLTLDHGNTVGVVAFDKESRIASGTSTGGLNGKLPGRVSDSAIIGAGTFSDYGTLGISVTGTGDQFIKMGFCRFVYDLITIKSLSLVEASQLALKELQNIGGQGGIIAIDGKGQIVIDYNSHGMFRAYGNHSQNPKVGIWGEEFSEP